MLSDLHLECFHFVPSVSSADIVVLAGDIGVGTQGVEWAKDAYDLPVIYVAGNHEFHDPRWTMTEHKTWMRKACEDSNIHLLDNDIVIIDGVRFIGTTLWSDLALAPDALCCDTDRIVVKYDINRSVSGITHFSEKYSQSMFEQNSAWLVSELAKPFDGKATVVITHHAPSFGSLHGQYEGNPWNACFISDLEHLMGAKVDLWLHGHTHNNFNYQINGTQVVCNPRGYPHPYGGWENSEFNPNFFVEV